MHHKRSKLSLLTLVWALALPLRCSATTIANASASVCHADGGQEYCPVDQRCHPDGDCGECDGRLTEDVDSHECIDRVLFTSHAPVDVVAAFIWFFGAGLAMSAGVGGGGIFVPLGVILLRFASKPSTGLSQASIFGASLAGFLINIRGRHPTANRPVIDIDMALFLAPMEMAGAMVGVLVQKPLPDWVVILLMATILGYTAYKTFKKGYSTFKKETAANRAAAKGVLPEKSKVNTKAVVEVDLEDSSAETDTPKPVTSETSTADTEASKPGTSEGVSLAAATLVMTPKDRPVKPAIAWESTENTSGSASGVSHLPSVREWLERDSRIQVGSVLSLFLMWLALVAFLALRGGKGTKGAVKYCSAGYWLVTVVSFLWLFGFSLCAGWRAVSRSIQKAAVGYPFVEGDVVWNWTKFRFYCLLTFIAGVVAGLIGIGGGMVLGPMMLQLGVLPQVSTATTATMIVMTSSSAAFMFVSSGLVPYSYAGTYFAIAFVGAYVGKTFIDKLVKRYKLTSIIIFILATIIAFASAMMTVNGVIIYSDKDWEFDGLKDAC